MADKANKNFTNTNAADYVIVQKINTIGTDYTNGWYRKMLMVFTYG